MSTFRSHRNNNGNHNSDSNEGATYETMSANEKKNLLLQICGVVSEHTKKLCTRFVIVLFLYKASTINYHNDNRLP